LVGKQARNGVGRFADFDMAACFPPNIEHDAVKSLHD
jgi:hypothetical protein